MKVSRTDDFAVHTQLGGRDKCFDLDTTRIMGDEAMQERHLVAAELQMTVASGTNQKPRSGDSPAGVLRPSAGNLNPRWSIGERDGTGEFRRSLWCHIEVPWTERPETVRWTAARSETADLPDRRGCGPRQEPSREERQKWLVLFIDHSRWRRSIKPETSRAAERLNLSFHVEQESCAIWARCREGDSLQ